MTNVAIYSLFLILCLLDTVSTSCYYNSYYNYYSCSYYYYLPIGSIVGAVIGSLVGLASLIGLIVFFCCIRPRRLAAAGHVIHTPGNNVAVVSATGTGGYVNTAAYPPGIQATYPQYTYPPQQPAPPSGYQPPPAYK
ncbi:uncharacterized protein LOC111108302 isoform X3 [Crassostrea virginica]|uniref:Uncharacterized protein LOC111108302 n=1 Tax=Crassostrea virginica TaxID=6565 RepID=A0A8B8B8Q3_CRAVI|nr:uncharacterized protein LOC111108302 [Crassostrea virginica]